MPVLYLHIGMPKTGTTAIQVFFTQHRKRIAEHTGLYYPRVFRHKHRQLFPIERQQKHWEHLRSELSRYTGYDILLSEENISLLGCTPISGENFLHLKKFFPSYDIKIILYVRRLDDYLKSRFCQEAKSCVHTDYAAYFTRMYASKNPCLFPSKLVDRCIALVGKENLILRIYEKSLLKNENSVEDFFQALNLSIPLGLSPEIRNNPTFPPKAIPLLSKRILTNMPSPELKKLLTDKAHLAYTLPPGATVGDNASETCFAEEIERLDALLPGYKALFTNRPLSFAFPETDACDPQVLYMCGLLYSLLERQEHLTREIAVIRGKTLEDRKNSLVATFKAKVKRITDYIERVFNL